MMFAVGTVVVLMLGFCVGAMGGTRVVLAGLAASLVVAALQFVASHPIGPLGEAGEWGWGAASLGIYPIAVAAGMIFDMRRRK